MGYPILLHWNNTPTYGSCKNFSGLPYMWQMLEKQLLTEVSWWRRQSCTADPGKLVVHAITYLEIQYMHSYMHSVCVLLLPSILTSYGDICVAWWWTWFPQAMRCVCTNLPFYHRYSISRWMFIWSGTVHSTASFYCICRPIWCLFLLTFKAIYINDTYWWILSMLVAQSDTEVWLLEGCDRCYTI